MKKVIVLLLLFISSQVYSQIIKLPDVVISAVNYKYLDAVDSENSDLTVKMLEEKVAMYNIKDTELYNDEYESYIVTFYIPDGKILAAYNKDGELTRTIERFKNIRLPHNVLNAISKRFPNWSVVKDIYKVNYHENNEVVKKQYKIRLENGNKSMKVKLDESGNFI